MRNQSPKSRKCYTDASNTEVTAQSLLERWENFTGAPETATDDELNRADEAGPSLMLNYFDGELDAKGVELVERCATISEDFRLVLIQVGKIVIGRQETERLLRGR